MSVRLTLCNTDDGVLVWADGPEAAAWAEEQQSVCGSKWEACEGRPSFFDRRPDAGAGFYAIVNNAPNLPQAIAAECDLDEACIDTSDWCPPVPPTLRNC